MPAPAEPRGRAVLPPLAADTARAALSPPRLPASSSADVALAEAAGAVAVPVRLEVPVAGGRTLLARALHRASGRGGPLVAPEGRWNALGELPAGTSVLIHAEALTPPAVPVLESLIDDGAAWLLVCSSESHPLPSVLAPRLEAVTVRVPPLGARLAELPDLARHLLAVLHARRGGSPPALMDDAVAHLTARPWPGDVGELEAVLARAMLRAHGGPIATRHLTGTDAPVSAAIVPDARRAQLEYLVAEIAHELRNPLATVKTFAQLPGLPENAELRTRFAALADVAVTRMNDVLENVLAFARLGTPVPVDVELGPLLDGLLADARPAFAERGIALDYVPANGARCLVDREQVAYALRNVLAGISREAPAQDVVRIDAASGGLVRVDFEDRDGTAARLRRLVLAEHPVDPDDRTLLPLVFTLARAVLERNGGTLTMDAGADGRAALEMRLGAPATGQTAQGG
jgi:signal transduction histidine kinase